MDKQIIKSKKIRNITMKTQYADNKTNKNCFFQLSQKEIHENENKVEQQSMYDIFERITYKRVDHAQPLSYTSSRDFSEYQR